MTAKVSSQAFTPVAAVKQYHIAAGAFFGLWGTGAGKSLALSDEGAALFGLSCVTGAAIGKELWDVSYRVFGDKQAQFDVNDIGATLTGGIVTVGLVYAGMKIFKKKPVMYAITGKNNFQIGFIKCF